MSDQRQLIESLEARIEHYEYELLQRDAQALPEQAAQTWRNLAMCYRLLAELQERLTNWLLAIKCLEQARLLFPAAHVEALARTEFDLARLYLAMARNRDAAKYLWQGKDSAQKALRFYTPDQPERRADYYELSLCLAEVELGLTQVTQSVSHAHDALKLAQRIVRLIQSGEDETDNRQTIYIEAHRVMGLSYLVQARFAHMPETVDLVRKAIQKLGVVRKYRHHRELARPLIRALHYLAVAYHMLARIERNPNHMDYAIRALQQAIDLNPDDQLHGVRGANLQMLGVLFSQIGDLEQAALAAHQAAHSFELEGDAFWMWMTRLQAVNYEAPMLLRLLILPLWWLIHVLLWAYHRLTGRIQI